LASIEKARLGDIYRQRFAELTQQERESLWRVLCEHFLQRYIPDDATVLDLAAGRCEFIRSAAPARSPSISTRISGITPARTCAS
jgi:hypothetical protein